ncbi:hypothetical protein GCM10007304_04300 [Rhodococcoides trifolii]|uniref:DUF3068 domain-containing protein n=1 Tax=Rhodococcoides trifolii TaxID=908250 RepID=A0A917CPZ0_9NOCA|nr:DUF3068 domain-containing protein [Rhodococcus trifolii]GGF93547.1 hypothetical protein GCM10007304_04300 [Rhodococcus trifolii]
MADRSEPRPIVPLVLVGLGVFLLVVAILMPTYMTGRLEKTPLDLEITTVSTGTGTVLNAASLTAGRAQIDQNVPLVSQRFVTTEEPSDSDTITVQAGSTLRRTDKQGDTGLLTALVDRVSADRKTAMPVDPVGTIQAQGDKPAEEVPHTGLQYKFPFGAEQKTYPFFDTVARQSFDMNFVEETEINGLPVYHYTQTIAPVDLSTVVNLPTNKLALPADTWGVPGGSVPITMTRFYENTRNIYVEPKTGVIVKGEEAVHQYYARRAETPDVDVLNATIGFDDNSVDFQLGKAREGIDQISLISRTIPIIAAIVGLISLLVGLFLLFFRKGRGTPATASGPRTSTAPPSAARPARGENRDFGDERTEEIPRTDLRKPPQQ